MTDTDLAWAAGFIDGEGCITILVDRGRHTAAITVGQVNRRPLDRLQEILGGSVGPCKDDKGGHFQWRVYAEKAAVAAEKLLPYLKNKDQQALYLLRFQGTKGTIDKHPKVTPEIADYQSYLYSQVKYLNRRRTRLDAERLNEDAPTQ